jgi:eukaryotic-like serine/threonine-protein kinase
MVDTPTVERLGRYRLLRRLGRGGMATVYHAVQEGPLGFENEVAVKVVHPELLDEHPFLLQNLVDEARIAARIRHPNVVRILDLVEEGERFYLVMDFVDGISMRQVLDRARQSGTRAPVGPILEVLAAAARGLDAAHRLLRPDGVSMGLVHRDVKPGNILVSHDGLVKVSDFGVALFGDRITENTMLGQMKGTPAYMSPEQAMGDPVSGRSDIFSLGLTLYTLMTSKLVHQAESAVRLAMMIASEPLEDQAAELEAMVPGMGELFSTACAKIPEDRYGDANQMAAALTALRSTIKAPASIAEMVAATGWQPREFAISRSSERGADLALADTADIALSIGDADGPSLTFEGSLPLPDGPELEESLSLDLDNSWDTSAADMDDDEQPTLAGVAAPFSKSDVLGPAHDDDDDDEPTDPGSPAPIESLDAPIESLAGSEERPRTERVPAGPDLDPFGPPPPDMEVTPVAPPPRRPVGETTADQPGPRIEVVIPGPSASRVDIANPGTPPPKVDIVIPISVVAPAPFPGGPLPPRPAQMESTLPQASRAPAQPVRDYRGRVVRNNSLQQNTSITKAEKVGIVVILTLLLSAVATIVGLQILRPTPDDHDPRFVDGALPAGPQNVVLPAEPTPIPTPPKADGSLKPPPPDNKTAAKAGDVIEPAGTAEAKAGELVPGAVIEHKTKTLDDRTREASAKRKKAAKKKAPTPEEAAEPAPAKPGTLVVNSYPWSRVFIDGVDIGTTPIRSHSLPAGKHEVKLVFPSADGAEHVQTVDIEPGGKAQVIKKLTPS